ncbi:hypothetical protein ATCC90586_000893 [Pythium insidiosum]|nr:hypothetical protein ATCC90586_000893 [Pythium insidiosum]
MKTAVVVTGASRGFGRCLAQDFCREIRGSHVDLVLWARHDADLQETARLARSAWSASEHELRVSVRTVDLSKPEQYAAAVDELLVQLQAERYERIYLVHNAGSLGELGYPDEWTSSPSAYTTFWEFNVTSVMWLNKRFLDVYGLEASPSTELCIVNVTSLCGIEPFRTHGWYCTSKAAREMHHRVLASEYDGSNGRRLVRVLSYSPGPMDTAMQTTLRSSSRVHPEYVAMFSKLKEEGTLLAPHASSRRGVRLALSGAFQSGAHVDYYDLEGKDGELPQ